VITFKEFLSESRLHEGGKATAEHGTTRANKADVVAALKFVSKTIGLSYDHLVAHLLGSTKQTLDGQKKDSGDLDIAMIDDDNRAEYEKKMTAAVGFPPRKTGANVLSYAVPTTGEKRVQVDLMFVPDVEWAKFSYHSEPGSKFKGSIRNLLIYALVLNTMEKGKDMRIKDDEGNDIARASRSFQLDTGVHRVFKVAPMRKDGKGRTKSAVKTTADEVEKVAKEMGSKETFSKEEDVIRDPGRFAKMLLGSKGTAEMLKTSAENLIVTIKKMRTDHAQIFKDALADIKRQKLWDGDPESEARYKELTGLE
jgi:hypothetical protein